MRRPARPGPGRGLRLRARAGARRRRGARQMRAARRRARGLAQHRAWTRSEVPGASAGAAPHPAGPAGVSELPQQQCSDTNAAFLFPRRSSPTQTACYDHGGQKVNSAHCTICLLSYKSRAPPALATQAGGRARSPPFRRGAPGATPSSAASPAAAAASRASAGRGARKATWCASSAQSGGPPARGASARLCFSRPRTCAGQPPDLPLLQVFAWLPATGRRTERARRSASAGSARAQARSSTASSK